MSRFPSKMLLVFRQMYEMNNIRNILPIYISVHIYFDVTKKQFPHHISTYHRFELIRAFNMQIPVSILPQTWKTTLNQRTKQSNNISHKF